MCTCRFQLLGTNSHLLSLENELPETQRDVLLSSANKTKERHNSLGGYGMGLGGLYEVTGHDILYWAWLPNAFVGIDYEDMETGYVDMDMGYVIGDSGTDECSCNCSCD